MKESQKRRMMEDAYNITKSLNSLKCDFHYNRRSFSIDNRKELEQLVFKIDKISSQIYNEVYLELAKLKEKEK